MKRALITGLTGFVGSHLSEFLLDKKFEVFGSVNYKKELSNIEHVVRG